MKQWCYSFYKNESYIGSYDSKEAAIKAAREDVEADRDAPFPTKHEKLYVGVEVEPPITWYDMAENYIESMQENLEEYGEYGENFANDYVTREDEEELDRRLNATVEQWIKDRNITPGFFNVDEIEEIDISDWYEKGAADNGDGK